MGESMGLGQGEDLIVICYYDAISSSFSHRLFLQTTTARYYAVGLLNSVNHEKSVIGLEIRRFYGIITNIMGVL